MNRVEKLGNRHFVLAAERDQQAVSGVSWALAAGVLTGTFIVQFTLAARLLVQLLALRGAPADVAYRLGGFFQRPFEGYSAGAVRTRGIFEPETVYAMTVYAAMALTAVLVFAMLRLSLHVTLWRAAGAAAVVLGRTAAWGAAAGTEVSVAAYRWMSLTGAPAARRASAAALARSRTGGEALLDEVQRLARRLTASVRDQQQIQVRATWPYVVTPAVESDRKPIPLRRASTEHPDGDNAA